jgi:hypothetical protein
MAKRIVIACALAAAASTGFAQTIVGGATLIDTATVINGTVNPTTFLTYVSGGDGVTGNANGSSFTILSPGLTTGSALATADHQWAQFDPVIVMHSNVALSDVIAIPAIDHGFAAGNTGEFWESFEFVIYGCAGATTGLTACEQGRITKVWTRGVDDSGASKNADDWTARRSFNGSLQQLRNLVRRPSGRRAVLAWRRRNRRARRGAHPGTRGPMRCSPPAWASSRS